ncbi:hypothetical protein LXL04_032537 [Taraxacum kok-saghyz]
MADPPNHFFKFVLPGFLFNLSIPSYFLTNLNVKICSKLILRRGRHEWSVDIDDGVFGDGWRRFVKENGVQEFDFIVFKHHGSMVFDFSVFDQSTCERQYPTLLDAPIESDTVHTEGLKCFEKRKMNEFASQDQKKFQVKKETGSSMKKKSSLTTNNYEYFISNLTPSNFTKTALIKKKKKFRRIDRGNIPVGNRCSLGWKAGEAELREVAGNRCSLGWIWTPEEGAVAVRIWTVGIAAKMLWGIAVR